MSEGAQATAPPKRNLKQQADFIAGLASRCVLFDEKGFAGKSYLFLSADDAAALEHVAESLAYLAKHEDTFKKAMSKGKQRGSD